MNSIVSSERFQITGGRLNLGETIRVDNTFLLKGPRFDNVATLSGTILRGTGGEGIIIAGESRLDTATIQTDVTINQAGTRLRVAGGLSLFGTVTVSGNDTAIGFEGDQEVTSGTFTSTSGGLLLTAIGTATVTFDRDVVIRGQGAIGNSAGSFLGSSTSVLHVINLGTIASAGAQFSLFNITAESMINHGLIAAEAEKLLNIGGKTWTNAADGRITVNRTLAPNFIQANFGFGDTTSWTNAGIIDLNDTFVYFMTRSDGLNQTWSNTGTLLVNNSIVNMYGRFTSDDLRNVRQTNQTPGNTGIFIVGQMDNTGRTFAPTTETGNFFGALDSPNAPGGRVIGGTIVNSGPNAEFIVGGILDAVTLSGDFHGGGFVVNGLTLNGTLNLYTRHDGLVNSLFFNGPQTISGGTFRFLQDPNLPGGSAAGMAAFSGGPVIFDANVTFQTVEGSGGHVTGNIISNATLAIAPNTVLELAGIEAVNPLFSGPFVNRGTLTVPSGAGLNVTEPFVNEGTIIVNHGAVGAGVWNPRTEWRNVGTIDLTNQGRLVFGSNGVGTNEPPRLRTSDLGTILDSGGFVSLADGAVLDNAGSTLVIGGTSDWRLENGTIEGGIIQVANTAKLKNELNRNGTLKDLTIDGNMAIAAGGTLSLVGDLTIHGTLAPDQVNGIITVSFGDRSRYPNVPTVIHSGTIDVRNFIDGSRSSDTVTLDPDVVLRGRNLQATFEGALLNRGQIVADRTNPNAIGDVLEFTVAPITNQGTLAAVNRSVLRIANLAPNEGVLSADAGSTIALTGSFMQTAGATVSVAIGGTAADQFGHVTIANAVSLAGTLDAQLVGGFVPAAGDRFEVMSYASGAGTFTTVQTTGLPAGLVLTPEYNATNLTLVVSAALQAAAPASASAAQRESLSPGVLQALAAAAIDRWAAAGIGTAELDRMRRVDLRVADLDGDLLGVASGGTITLDNDAAGYGWFIDPTPFQDEEFEELLARDVFRANRGENADNRMDLLTAILHEMGHVAGLEHVDDGILGSLMSAVLDPGIRRLPEHSPAIPG